MRQINSSGSHVEATAACKLMKCGISPNAPQHTRWTDVPPLPSVLAEALWRVMPPAAYNPSKPVILMRFTRTSPILRSTLPETVSGLSIQCNFRDKIGRTNQIVADSVGRPLLTASSQEFGTKHEERTRCQLTRFKMGKQPYNFAQSFKHACDLKNSSVTETRMNNASEILDRRYHCAEY